MDVSDELNCKHQSYLNGQSDVSVGTKAPSPVAGAVVEASSWETENSLAQCQGH